ncbi:hypothetical protein ACEWPM_009530 [Roseovarius sp. S4756]|uniref:hypothetical protein n=1 Tax=Roseovarius maritimus TaxID=3342637 RepID=UPI00372C6EF1
MLLLITALLAMAMASGPMARAAMPATAAGVDMVVICINGAAVDVVVDSDGQPVPHDPTVACDSCPACALTGTAAPTQSDVPVLAASFTAVRAAGDAAFPPRGASVHRAHARGPPPKLKNI